MNEIERHTTLVNTFQKRDIPVLELIPMWVLADSKEVWYRDFGMEIKLYDTQYE